MPSITVFALTFLWRRRSDAWRSHGSIDWNASEARYPCATIAFRGQIATPASSLAGSPSHLLSTTWFHFVSRACIDLNQFAYNKRKYWEVKPTFSSQK